MKLQLSLLVFYAAMISATFPPLDLKKKEIIKLHDQAEGFLKSLKIIEKNCLDFLQHINEEHPPKRSHGPGESA